MSCAVFIDGDVIGAVFLCRAIGGLEVVEVLPCRILCGITKILVVCHFLALPFRQRFLGLGFMALEVLLLHYSYRTSKATIIIGHEGSLRSYMHGHCVTEMDDATRLIFVKPIESRSSVALSAAVRWVNVAFYAKYLNHARFNF